MAFVVIVVLLALCTPVADPRRLSVEEPGGAAGDRQGEGPRRSTSSSCASTPALGRDALDRLKASPNAEIARRAKEAFMLTERSYAARQTPRPSQAPRLPSIRKAPPPAGFATAPGFAGDCLSGDSASTRGCST
jgi:hypothetical protein